MRQQNLTKKRLNQSVDVFTGLFEHIEDPLWQGRYQADDMTLEFLSKHGTKPISNLIKAVNADTPLTEAQLKKIMGLIYRKFEEQWKRQYETLDSVYKVLDNYNMVESETIDRSSIESRIQDVINTSSLTQEQKNTLIEKLKRIDDTKERRTGTDTNSGQNTNKNTRTDGTTTTNTRTDNTTEDISYINRKDTETRNLTKIGDGKDIDRGGNYTDNYFLDRTDSREARVTDAINDRTNTTASDDKRATGTNTETKSYAGNNGTQGSGGGTGAGQPTFTPTERTVNERNLTDSDTASGESRRIADNRNTTFDTLTKNGNEITDQTVNNVKDKNYFDSDKGTVATDKTGTDRRTNTGTVKDVTGLTGTTVDDTVIGVNMDTIYNTTNANTGTVDHDNKTTNDTNNTTTGNETTLDDTQTTNDTNEERTLTRSGNIGVTTSVQMLREHVQFWVDFSFLDIVYQDTAKMLTLPIYQQEANTHGNVQW